MEKSGLGFVGGSVGPFLAMIEKMEKDISSVHTFLFRIHWSIKKTLSEITTCFMIFES